ncbi:MAG: phosphoglycerate kinase [Leptospiraceae bacterium]|nr:phosphoglycerate kinase [Leptospiraceae bacterium]
MAGNRLESAPVQNKRVLMSIDCESILAPDGELIHDVSLRQAQESIELLVDRRATVLLVSSAASGGRALDLSRAAKRLSDLLKQPVDYITDPLGNGRANLESRAGGSICLLENLMSVGGESESKAEKAFANELAALADLYVNDAPGNLHLQRSSLIHLPGLLPGYMGLEFHKFLEHINSLDQLDSRPLVLLLGGNQVERQNRIIRRFLERVQVILLGGATAYTFMKGRALPIGASLVDRQAEVSSFQTIERAELSEAETVFPLDHLAADQFSRKAKPRAFARAAIPDGWFGMDIGPKTVAQYDKILKQAQTVLWYGPMGAIEFDQARKGSEGLAKSLAKHKGRSVVMGQDTVRIVHESGNSNKVSLNACSSAAALAILLKEATPALDALRKADQA